MKPIISLVIPTIGFSPDGDVFFEMSSSNVGMVLFSGLMHITCILCHARDPFQFALTNHTK